MWQLFDSLTWLRGNHSLKFGTELRLTQANNLQKIAPSGSFGFPTTLTDNAAPIAGNRMALHKSPNLHKSRGGLHKWALHKKSVLDKK